MRYDPSADVNFQLDRMLNNGLEFADNVRGGFIEFETTGAEQEIEHNLGYVPIGWLLIYSNGEVTLWAGATEWTTNSMFLVSSASSVTVRLFVM